LNFYEDLLEHFSTQVEPARAWHRTVSNCYQTMLDTDGTMDRIYVAELPSYPNRVRPPPWLFVQVGMNAAAFYDALKSHLLTRYPQAGNLASLIDYQREMFILPDYDRRVGKRFHTDLDWPSYFNDTKGRTGTDSRPEPDATPRALIQISDQTCGERGYLVQPLSWESKSGEARWLGWIVRTVLHRASNRKQNFQQISLTLAGGATRPAATASAQV